MGKYINVDSKGNRIGTSYNAKLSNIMADGAVVTENPVEYQENLVVAINNGPWGAVAYAYNEREFEYFNEDLKKGVRPYTWLIYEHAEELAK